MSLINIMNYRGPSIDPWGTPFSIFIHSLFTLHIFILWWRLCRYLHNTLFTCRQFDTIFIDKPMLSHPPPVQKVVYKRYIWYNAVVFAVDNKLYFQSIFLFRSCLFQLHVPVHPLFSDGGNRDCPANVGPCMLPQMWFVLIFMPGDASLLEVLR